MSRPTKPSLLFVNQYYAPDVAATGQCLADLAEFLAEDGYDVTVLVGRTRYGATRADAPAREVRNGVHVRRLATTTLGRGTVFGRVIDYASFYIAVLFALLVGRRHDGVILLTTPPLIGWLGRVALALRGQRYAIWSMDLHPEAEIAAGMLRPRSVMARVLAWIDASAYRGADFVVDLGPHMRRRISHRGVSWARSHTVHIWGGRAEIPRARTANPLAERLALADRFVVMYSGNAGIVHDFGAICEAMRQLRDDPRIYFLFVGDGPRRADVEGFAAREGIPNFAYHDYFPRELLPYSLSLASVHLISLGEAFAGISVPSKLYGAMASSRPILFVGPGASEPADAVRDARCGVIVDPSGAGDVVAGARIAAVLRAWADVPAVAEELGARARCAFVERYERRLSCAAFESVLRSAWEREPQRGVRRGLTRHSRAPGGTRVTTADPPATAL